MAENTQGTEQSEGIYTRLKNHLPQLPKVLAIIILIFNIFLPGVGTMLLFCVGGSFRVEHLVVGLLQLVLSVFVIGWIWSVLWGVILVLRCKD